jgi:hypothetical protein
MQPGELKQVAGSRLDQDLRPRFEELVTDLQTHAQLSVVIQRIFDKLNPIQAILFLYVTHK